MRGPTRETNLSTNDKKRGDERERGQSGKSGVISTAGASKAKGARGERGGQKKVKFREARVRKREREKGNLSAIRGTNVQQQKVPASAAGNKKVMTSFSVHSCRRGGTGGRKKGCLPNSFLREYDSSKGVAGKSIVVDQDRECRTGYRGGIKTREEKGEEKLIS